MMARAPWAPGKTRLAALSADQHAALRLALFHDTLDVLRATPHVNRYVICDPPGAGEEMIALVGTGVSVLAQGPGDLGQRLSKACVDLFRLGPRGVIVVGSDLPDLPRDRINTAARILSRAGDPVVLGPSTDGGYYLVGLKAPHPELFQAIDWGTDAVMRQTVERAQQAGLRIHLLAPWSDIDEWSDLERLRTRTSNGGSRTRKWLAALDG